MGKAILGALSAGVMVLTLLGCSGTPEQEVGADQGTAAEEIDLIEEAAANCADAEVTGDVIIGEPVETLGGGVFCGLKLNPDGEMNTFMADERVNQSLLDAGYTYEELASAQVWGAQFLITNTISGPALGANYEDAREWVLTNENLSEELQKYLVNEDPIPQGEGRISRIAANLNTHEFTPPAVADGGPQVTDVQMKVAFFRGVMDAEGSDEPEKGVDIRYDTTTTYRIDPDEYVEWRKTLLTNFDKAEYLYTVEEEGQDFSKPLFMDVTRSWIVRYLAEDVRAGVGNPPPAMVVAFPESMLNVLAYN